MIFEALSTLISAGGAGVLAALIIAGGVWMYMRHRQRRRRTRVRRDFVDMLQAYRHQRVRQHIRMEVARIRGDFHAHVASLRGRVASCGTTISQNARTMSTVITTSAAWQGLSPAGHPASKALLKSNQWNDLLAVASPHESGDASFRQALGVYLVDSGAERVRAVLAGDIEMAQALLDRAETSRDDRARPADSALCNEEEDLRRVQRLTQRVVALFSREGVLAWCDPEALSLGTRVYLEDKFAARLSNMTIDGVARTVIGPVKSMELINWLQRAAQPPLLLPASDVDRQRAHSVTVLELPSAAGFLQERAAATLSSDVRVRTGGPDVIQMTSEIAGLSLRLVFDGNQSIRDSFVDVLQEANNGRRETPYVSPQAQNAVAESAILDKLAITINAPVAPLFEVNGHAPPNAEPTNDDGGTPTGDDDSPSGPGVDGIGAAPREERIAEESDILKSDIPRREDGADPAFVERWNRMLRETPGFWIDPEEDC